jgi:hypothetical protein
MTLHPIPLNTQPYKECFEESQQTGLKTSYVPPQGFLLGCGLRRYSAYRYLLQMPLPLVNCPPTARAGQARGVHYLACVLSFIPPHAGMTGQREGKNIRFDPNKDL